MLSKDELLKEMNGKMESILIRVALQDEKPLSFYDAIDACHWTGRKVRIKGADWFLRAAKKDGRYALWVNDSDVEYITKVDHVFEQWETF